MDRQYSCYARCIITIHAFLCVATYNLAIVLTLSANPTNLILLENYTITILYITTNILLYNLSIILQQYVTYVDNYRTV